MSAALGTAPPRVRWRTPGLGVLLALLVASVVLLEPVTVRSTSMSPTLNPGDRLVVEKLTTHLEGPDRGDLVVFAAPGTTTLMVKRVVAVGGDTVGLADGVLVVNAHAVHEEYVDLESVDGVWVGPYVVPAGHVYVLGDDRANSVDSRAFGPVPVDRVVGRVLFRVW